jgi:hypothetical protein
MNEQMSGCILRVSVGMRDETRPAQLTMHPSALTANHPRSGPYPHVGANGRNPPTPACNHPVTAAQRATIHTALSIRSAMGYARHHSINRMVTMPVDTGGG